MYNPESALPTRNPEVVFKALDEGAVLLSTVEEVYYGLNQIGARIWALLPPATSTFGELCAILAGEHPDVDPEQLRRDAQLFLDDIVTNHLVTHEPASPHEDTPAPDA